VQLGHLEGIQDVVAVIIQLASGNNKLGQGVGRVGMCRMGVEVL